MNIKLSTYSNTFSTRQRAQDIFKTIPNEEEVVVDFSDILSVTPSFMHEMLLIFKEKKCKEEYRGMSKSVEFQFKKARLAM